MGRFVLVVGLIAVAIGIGSAGYGVWTSWRQHQVITSARPAMAKVLRHQTKELKGGGFVAQVPLVTYTYKVNQQPYTADSVTPAELMLPDTWAEAVFQQFPIGAQAQANYDPSDPSKAFLIAKYSVMPYLPLLVGLAIAGLGLGVVGELLTCHDAPRLARTTWGAVHIGAKQHHLAHARVLGIVGIVGLVCGAPAIAHHLVVSTAPHERMGFLLEGGYAIAVLTALARSALIFRRGAGFGTPVVTLDQSPAVGHSNRLNVSVPTRFNGTAQLNVCLKCEAKDKRLFNLGEEKPDQVLLQQHYELAASQAAFKGGEIAGTIELNIPDHLPSSTPVESAESIHVVWSLLLTASGNGGRKAETEYILFVAKSPRGQPGDAFNSAGADRPAAVR